MKKTILYIYNDLPSWCKNRYFLSACIFLIWISLFDTNSLIVQISQKKEVKKIQGDIEYYKEKIQKDNSIIDIVSQDSLTPEFEKYLRENLYLSKENEEIFIIE